MMKSTRRGFTLIELLVVIAIIGILSSVVLASLNTARKKGRDARRIADIKQLQLALELYYDANGSYATSTSATNLVTPGYIASVPADPSNQVAYSYSPIATSLVPGTCVGYHIGASLEVTGNTALNSDADQIGYASGYALCTGGVADFSGADAGQCKGTDVGSFCYDVKS